MLGTILAAFLALFLVSCEGEENALPDGFSFNFNPKEVTIPATGGGVTVAFTAPYDWSIDNTADWIQVTPNSGTKGDIIVEVKVGANPARESRNATISVTLPEFEFSQSLQVTQLAWDPSLALTEQLINAPLEGSTATFTVKATSDWAAAADVPWITVSPESGGFGETEVTVTVAANPVALEREGVITVAGEGQSASLTVKQAAADEALNLSLEAIEAKAAGEAITVNVFTTLEWSAVAADEWVSVEPATGDYGESAVVITVAENEIARPRESSVLFTSGNRSVQLPVKQVAADPWITLSSNAETVGPDAGTIEFTLTSNADWEAAEEADWLSFAPAGNFGETAISVAFDTNPVVIAREGVITFTAGSAVATFTLSQEAAIPVLTLASEASLEASHERSSFNVSFFTTEAEWRVESNMGWITIDPATGVYGEIEVVATVAENDIARPREGAITIVAGELTQVIAVKQAAAPAWIELSGYEVEFASGSGSLILTVSTNADWTVATQAEWIALSVEAGEPGEAQVSVAVEVNDSPDPRSADIVFTTVDGTATLKLAQKGRDQVGGLTGDIGEWGDGGEAEYGRK